MALLELEGVKKVYGQGEVKVEALRGIDLEIGVGEFSTIFGPSGSGKTTLLNLIGALDKPTEGSVRLNGSSIGKMNKNKLAMLRRENIGFIFQDFNLIPVLTAFENVDFALKIASKNGVKTGEKAKEVLEMVGLGEKLNRRPRELSGGQKQRVAIARALVKEPKLILADEPTANLDSDTAQGILEIMLRMNKELNTTFIFSTHDPRVMEYARRLLEIRDGRITRDERRE